MSLPKLNPAIAKLATNGQIQCLICSSQVNPKAWLAHLNGRQHKNAVESKRKELSAPKRTMPEMNGPTAKKSKSSSTTQLEVSSERKESLPADFFETESSIDISASPWQKGLQEEKEKMNRLQSAGILEGVPKGFFDDKKKDSQVKDTIEKNAKDDAELELLMKEINEQETQNQQQLEEEIENEAKLRELRNIDEQMDELRRLNELEVRKEQILRHRRSKQPKSEEDDVDLEELEIADWRSSHLF